jgi:MFS family permease
MTAAAEPSAARLGGDFWRLWLAQSVSSLGGAFTAFALPLLVYQRTGSAGGLALSTAVGFLPYLLFGLVVGAWVDRADRKRLMVAVELLRALLVASVPLLSWAGALGLWWIYAVQFASAVLAIIYNAADVAALPALVRPDALVAANGRLLGSMSAMGIVGPLLAGWLSSLVALPALLAVDALSFLASALLLALIRTSFNQGQPRPAASLRRDIAEGLRFVWRSPPLRAVSLLLLCLNLFGPTARTQLVLFAARRLGADSVGLGWLYAAGSAGVVVCSLLVGKVNARGGTGSLAAIALVAGGALTVVFSQVRGLLPAALLWALIGGASVVVDVAVISLRQRITPNALLGRVVTTTRMVGFAAIPLGALLGGWLIDATGDVALVYALVGSATVAVGLVFRGALRGA